MKIVYGVAIILIISFLGKCAYDIRKSGENKQQLIQTTKESEQKSETIKDIKRVKKTREADLAIPSTELVNELCELVSCIDDPKN